MPETVVAGSVLGFVGAVEWHEYHLVVYLSQAHEIVVLNDAEILQIISIHRKVHSSDPQKHAISVALNNETAAIAVASLTSLFIYECQELFGQLPRWNNTIKTSLNSAVSSLSWLGSRFLACATADRTTLLWDLLEQRVSWTEPIGHREVICSSSVEDPMLATYDADSYVIICVRLQIPTTSTIDIKTKNTFPLQLGMNKPSRVWFIQPDLLAVFCASNNITFLWKINMQQESRLIASIPSSNNIDPYCEDGSTEDGPILVYTESDVYQLNYTGTPATATIVKDGGIAACHISTADTFFSTNARVYIVHKEGVLEICDRSSQLLATVNGTSSHSSSVSLTGTSDLLLAGSSLFHADGLRKLWEADIDDLVQTCFVSENQLLAATIHTLGLYEIPQGSANKSKRSTAWQITVSQAPLSVSLHGSKVAMITQTKVFVLNISDGAILKIVNLPFQAQKAAPGTDRICIYGHSHLQILSLESMLLSSLELLDDEKDSNVTALSIINDNYVAAATDSEFTIWQLDGRTVIGSIKTKQIAQMEWSSVQLAEGTVLLLAVLTGTDLQIYTVLNRVFPQIVLVSQLDLPRIPLNIVGMHPIANAHANLVSLALFNGQQLSIMDLLTTTNATKNAIRHFSLTSSVLTVPQLLSALGQPIPVYHPAFLLLMFRALKPRIVLGILVKLSNQISYAEEAECDDHIIVTILDPALGCTEISEFEELGSKSTYENISTLTLSERRLVGITERDQAELQKIINLFKEVPDLDPHAVCALMLFEAYENKPEAISYAWLSKTKPLLEAKLNSTSHRTEGDGLEIWLDRDALANEMELAAKKEFAQTRDPTNVTLYYLALRKLPVLKTLWRISGGHPERDKTLKLLQNDFSTPRWRTAAQKNAYALLGRRRFLYAAAFFLLGNAITDCCQILISKLPNIGLYLAIAVARVYDSDNGRGLQFILDQMQSSEDSRNSNDDDNDNDNDTTNNNAFMCFYLLSVMGQQEKAVNSLKLDISTMFMYALEGGQFDDKDKKAWLKMLEQYKIPKLVKPLIDELEQKVIAKTSPATTSNSELHSEEPANEALTAETSDENKTDENKTDEKKKNDDDWESRPMPKNLKPAPVNIQLEPDMSAFGF